VENLPLPLRHQQLIILLLLVVVVQAAFLSPALPQPEAVQEDCVLGRYQSLAALPTPLRSVLVVLLAVNPILKGVMGTPQYSVQ
jgi:hypothetical protein